jgi:hypothetical protein
VPKVSIDGQSHGDLLLVAIGTGATFAVIILIVLTSLIRHKKKPGSDGNLSQTKEGNFTLATSPSDSGISTSSSQKSNLMFKFFGKSLSSFDVEKMSTIEMKSSSSSSSGVAINIESHDQNQFYRQNILVASILKSDDCDNDSAKSNYIQTISC